jgi:hypothetical protein
MSGSPSNGRNSEDSSVLAEVWVGLTSCGLRTRRAWLITHLQNMKPDLTDEEADALARLLRDAIDADRYPPSPRVQLLKGILSKIRPEPQRQPRKGRTSGASSRRRKSLA